MNEKIASIVLHLALKLPEWLYGRKVLLDLSLMYIMITAIVQSHRFEA